MAEDREWWTVRTMLLCEEDESNSRATGFIYARCVI